MGRVLVVDDQEPLREMLGQVLQLEGYEISLAADGSEALARLRTEPPPDLIIFDLQMPVMDGWEFRMIQRDDPKLGAIPVVALSADRSTQASAISAQGFLRKPVDPHELLTTVERILFEAKRRAAAPQADLVLLGALDQLAANVGHEINNPLSIVLLNLHESLEILCPARDDVDRAVAPLPEVQLDELKARVDSVTSMLKDCEIGSERIRATVSELRRLSGRPPAHWELVDVPALLDTAVSLAWAQLQPRARVTKTIRSVAAIRGDAATLTQLFVNLLLNAAEAIPPDDQLHNEIRIVTWLETSEESEDLVIEIRDSGQGIAPENMSRLFEPLFTTKRLGESLGLGLSLCRRTIRDHGGRMTFESAPSAGTIVRVFLPVRRYPSASP